MTHKMKVIVKIRKTRKKKNASDSTAVLEMKMTMITLPNQVSKKLHFQMTLKKYSNSIRV
jgi:hypothetical protein